MCGIVQEPYTKSSTVLKTVRHPGLELPARRAGGGQLELELELFEFEFGWGS